MTTQPPTFDQFAIVELFGHSRIAGRVTEQVIAGQGFVRVDVPACPATKYHSEQAGFTRLYGPSAVYSITPVDEGTAFAAAQGMRVEAVNVYVTHLLPRPSEDDIESEYPDGDDGDES